MKRKLSPKETFLYPTPCVLVSCGINNPNIITIAWCGVACSSPPMLYASIRPQRYSYNLIKDDGVFGINIPTSSMVKEVDKCGIVSGRKVNKFELCNFEVMKGEVTGVPLIKECPVNIELKLSRTVELGVHTMFIGEVVAVYINEDFDPPKVEKLSPICYIPFSGEYYSLGSAIGHYGFSK